MPEQANPGAASQSVPRPQLPAIPRPITPGINRRAWFDPHARFWLLVSLVIAAAATGLTIARTQDWTHKRWLISSGTPALAKVIGVTSLGEPAGIKLSSRSNVYLKMNYQGQDYLLEGVPETNADSVEVGQMLPIRIDPVLLLQEAQTTDTIDDPRAWTASETLQPWYRETFVGLLVYLLALPTLIGALLRRRKILEVWRNGQLEEAVILDAKPTALAPASRLVRCILREQKHDRVVKVIVPRGNHVPQEGDTLWLLVPREKTSAAQAVASYPA